MADQPAIPPGAAFAWPASTPRFEIRPVVVVGEPDAHCVRLHIDHQSFDINDYCETREQAEWLARQLEVALRRLVP